MFSRMLQSWQCYHSQVEHPSMPLFPRGACQDDQEEATAEVPLPQPFQVHLACPLLETEAWGTVLLGLSISPSTDRGNVNEMEAGGASVTAHVCAQHRLTQRLLALAGQMGRMSGFPSKPAPTLTCKGSAPLARDLSQLLLYHRWFSFGSLFGYVCT